MEGWALQLGVGQGCVNATRRAKLQVAIIQRAVSQLCEGFDFADGAEEGARVPQCFYADDGSFMADSLWGMQTCLDTCWWVCHVLGIQMIIKGKKKTAWQGRCWVGGRQQDVTGVVVRLPNGEVVPQLEGGEEYTHLGFEEGTEWRGRHATVRTKVVEHCTRVVGMIGRVQGLSLEQVQMAIALAVEGVIGYFGRAVHIDGPTCEKIERAIEEVLATRGWGAGRGAHRAARQKGGMGWTSVRAMAAAAYVSEMHRVLNGGDGEPAKVVLAKRIEQVVWRLAGRGDPLEWHPTHLKTILNGDDTVEAWLLCKLEAGVRTRRAAAQRTGEAGGAARVWARVKSGESRSHGSWQRPVWPRLETCTTARAG